MMQEKYKLLAEVCRQTYVHYRKDGIYRIPEGYKHIGAIKASALGEEEWFGIVIESNTEVIVAFRGTFTDTEWLADALAVQTPYPYAEKAGKVHEGFLSIYESCRSLLFEVYKKIPKNKPLIITGHSLGGALATLHSLDVSVNERFENVSMVNFASPRVGNQKFCSFYNSKVKNSTRIVNVHDIVPILPPFTLSCPFSKNTGTFLHVKNKLKLDVNKNSIDDNHSLKTYLEGLNK
jgi:triacylglycerol lipase